MSGREEGPVCTKCNKRESVIMKIDMEETSDKTIKAVAHMLQDPMFQLAWCSCGHIWTYREDEKEQTHWMSI
jgi:hypothetical protein